MTTYFGEPWPSGVCDCGRKVATPIDDVCLYCDEAIEDGDQGFFVLSVRRDGIGSVPVHRECGLCDAMGGIGHVTDHEHWCVGVGDPHAGLSYRDSALATWNWIREHGTSTVPSGQFPELRPNI